MELEKLIHDQKQIISECKALADYIQNAKKYLDNLEKKIKKEVKT